MKKYKTFGKIIFAYLKSMRPYLFFLSGMAGWLGIVFAGGQGTLGKKILILAIVFLGWGINQVINDILGTKEDKINAPHRPTVTGELPIKAAISISVILFLAGAAITFILNEQALVLYLFVFILNIVYEYSKKIPFLGNVVFGVLLVPCVYYGAMCFSGQGLAVLKNIQLLILAVAVFLINITVAFFTYYKDYLGDKLTGNKTIIVKLGLEKARYLNFIMSILPFAIVLLPFYLELGSRYTRMYFLFFVVVTFIIMQYTAFLFFKFPEGKKTYYLLKWNFRGAVLYMTSFIALVNPFMTAMLYIINFILVGYLFDLHKDYMT